MTADFDFEALALMNPYGTGAQKRDVLLADVCQSYKRSLCDSGCATLPTGSSPSPLAAAATPSNITGFGQPCPLSRPISLVNRNFAKEMFLGCTEILAEIC